MYIISYGALNVKLILGHEATNKHESALIRNVLGKVGKDQEPVFVRPERRGGEIGIRLPGGEWLSVAEAKVSPKCKNVIAWDKEHGPVPWRSKLTLSDIAALASIKKGK